MEAVNAVNTTEEDNAHETREEKFQRIAGNRINRILGDLTLIEQMSSGNAYRFESEDVEAMLGAIDNALARVRQRYMLVLTAAKPKVVRQSFKF